MSRLWDKGLPLDERVLRYTAGEDHLLDERLVEHDIRGSVAHADMLCAQGLLSRADCDAICDGLQQIGADHAAGKWHIRLEDEDAHTAIENRLIALIGPTGGRLHLGRSRNDQVLTALRLYLLAAIDEVSGRTRMLCESLGRLAARQGGIALPGYTHMQQAMPSSVALWGGGFAASFEDAIDGLGGARRRLSMNPLGSAAGFGTPGLDLDREHTTRALGFAQTQNPVTAVQLSRGKGEAGLLFELALLQQDLGRLASDLLMFYTQEFAYVALATEVTTGSSIMPQKRNPDVLELVRAAGATAHACLDECLMVAAKLPSGFQRDLQRVKAPLFRSIDLAIDGVDIMALVIDGLAFRPENIRLDEGLYAAEQAYALVREEGIPFREAYRRIAQRYGED
ncbi:MAG: argininosuccinate lyase [Gammaproteobacteria bacterium]|nr:argininosuccinate lyase [Gammaproteobacteria bacterium]MDH4254992.1 argininosuccinate lyase [Gammaproteobacteria bacterium]MDH5311075.1 argininosuccinate lyase [Gammaproteobacteria bacterium]